MLEAMRLRFFFLFASVPFLAFLGCAEKTSSSNGSSGTPPVAPTVSPGEGGIDPTTGTIRYLALGDSLTQGIGADNPETGAFPAKLAERWRAKGCKVELKNVGVSGYTASQILSDQVPEIEPFKPTFITFQTGANDIANGVTTDAYRTDVKAVLDAAKKSGARVVVLLQNEWFRAPEGPNYGGTAEKRATYDTIMIEEVKARNIEIADLRLLYQQQADQKLWVADGIHPTGAAYDAWSAELARIIPAPCGK